MFEFLTEKIKKPFLKTPIEKMSVNIPYHKVEQELDNSDVAFTGLFDNVNNGSSTDIYQRTSKQAQKIDIYRQISRIPQCYSGINEIVDEIAYSRDFKIPIKIEIEIKNKKIANAIEESFNKIIKLLGVQKNIHNIVRSSYIDGQINVLLEYNENERGIKNIYYLDPKFIYFDFMTQTYKYNDYQSNIAHKNNFMTNTLSYFILQRRLSNSKTRNIQNLKNLKMDTSEIELDIEELVHQDFGLHSEDGLILSELENCIKPANQLKTLEDLLIPLRFSRSVSRRVFNVDLTELPNSKAEAYMRELTNKFKYKKQYNTITGEVINNQHITTMVEDYWVGNKSGAKGLQVDVLDETGNLGELGDILYFYRLLYKSMGIPTNRIYLDDDARQPLFDLNADAITNEDIKFFQKITRLRLTYSEFILKILKRELISTRQCSEEQFENELKENINIYFTEENQFIDRMNISLFMKKIDAFNAARDLGGTALPIDTLYKEIFKFTDKEIKQTLQTLQKEAKNPLYKPFYFDKEAFADMDDLGDDNSDEEPVDDEPEVPQDNSQNAEPEIEEDENIINYRNG